MAPFTSVVCSMVGLVFEHCDVAPLPATAASLSLPLDGRVRSEHRCEQRRLPLVIHSYRTVRAKEKGGKSAWCSSCDL